MGLFSRIVGAFRTVVPKLPFGRIRTVMRHGFNDWTPATVKQALNAHEQGRFYESARLGEAMRRDARVFATLESIVSACLSGDRNVSGNPANVALVDPWVWKTVNQNVSADIIRSFVMYGFAIGEMHWAKDEKTKLLYPTIRVLSPANVRYDTWRNKFFFMGADGAEIEIVPGDGRWLLFSAGATDYPFLNGAIRAIAMPWLIRTDVIGYWIRRTELESTGAKKAKVPAGADIEAAKAFLDNAKNLGAESTILAPDGYDLDFVTADMQATTNFAALVDRQDTAITLAILRQNLTTQIEGGSLASAQVHAKVLQDNAQSILRAFSDFISQQIIRAWFVLNFEKFDDDTIAVIDIRPAIDKQQEAQALLTLSQALDALRTYGAKTNSTLKKFGLDIDESKTSDKGQIYAYHIQAGLFTINEVRKSLGFEPIPGGDVLTQKVDNAQPT